MRPFVPRRRLWPAVLALLLAAAIVAVAAWTVRAGGPPDGAAAPKSRDEASSAPAAVTTSPLQEAADGAALKGTWMMVDYQGSDPATDILCRVNTVAEAYGVPDSNDVPGDPINDNVLVYYVYFDGSCVPLGGGCWELHAGPNVIPAGARGLRVDLSVPPPETTFPTGAYYEITATAAARYVPDGGLLPIAANEYWRGTQGQCPYANCGDNPPYSFVRDPAQEAPFELVSSSPEVWAKNFCPDPYNNNVCQGPYQGYGENFGKAFALMGGDAKPNYGSMTPRGAAMLDCRYDALTSGGTWNMLLANDQWEHDTSCPAMGFCKDAMAQVIYTGGYGKVPLPRSALEPPIAYIGDWPYCWASPPNEDNCFNYPAMNRGEPYDSLMFLNGASASYLAQVMYDGGNYVEGRHAPGERIVVMAYNSYPAIWGQDTAVIVGYFGATIVGYGSAFAAPCSGTPGDWQSYTHCISGQPNTVYGLAGQPLVLDPTRLLNEWPAKRVELIPPP